MVEFVRLPKLSMTMESGSVEHWLKQEGDTVKAGELLLEVQTDKAVLEVTAEAGGVLRKIYVAEGVEVPVNTVIAAIGDVDEPVPAAPDDAPVALPSAAPRAAPSGVYVAEQTAREGRVKVSPVARKLAMQYGLDPAQIVGIGPGGRVEKKDVIAAAQARRGEAAGVAAPPLVRCDAPPPAGEEVRPLAGMRAAIAKRASAAARDIPHITLRALCNAVHLVALRERLRGQFEAEGHPAPTINDLLIAITASALARHPRLNGTLCDNTLRTGPVAHIGIVVAVDGGLLIPVLRDAGRLTLRELVAQRRTLVEQARAGHLPAAALEGGTFTISNLGATGVDSFTPIINPPQLAMLAVGAVAQRAVVYNGAVLAAPTLELTLAVDHRALDGYEAGQFLATLRDFVEQPAAAVRP